MAAAQGLLAFAFVALLTWVAWAVLMFHIGTRILPEPQTEPRSANCCGRLALPVSGLLQVFAVFPGMAVPVFVSTTLWMFAAMVVSATRA